MPCTIRTRDDRQTERASNAQDSFPQSGIGSEVHTDELRAYGGLGTMGYWHKSVNHAREEYVSKTVTTVNALEGFWAALKRGINGTHIHVSAKHLPTYLGEFEFRWNMRYAPHLMLDRLIASFAR